MEVSNKYPTALQAVQHKYLPTLLCDFAGTPMDTKTGELLENCHFTKHPKYKKNWGYLFGNKMRQSDTTQEFWKHIWHLIIFVLVVDGFDVKYVGKKYPHCLHKVIQKCYVKDENEKRDK